MNEEKSLAILPRAELSVNADGSSLETYNTQLSMIKSFVQSQLRQETDYGVIPGTTKPTLYKPGAEKLAKLFNLGVSKIESVDNVDFEKNIAYLKRTVYLDNLATGRTIAVCEGSTNSQEKKYKERKKYENNRVVGYEPIPIGDILNTLNKMAIKRAYVGAVIMAVGASDFFTQDLEDMKDHEVDRSGPQGVVVVPPTDKELSSMSLESLGKTIVPNGKYGGRSFEDIGVNDLSSYVEYFKKQPDLKGWALKMVQYADQYIALMKDMRGGR